MSLQCLCLLLVLLEISLEKVLGQCDELSLGSSGNYTELLGVFYHFNIVHKQHSMNSTFASSLANISILY